MKILSPALTLFIVILPKANLTLHSKMSGSRWVITPSWSGSWRSYLYSSSVYSFHLFLKSPASVRSMPFLSLLCPSLHKIFPWYLWFSWRELWSFTFYCFPLFPCIYHWGRLSHLSLLLLQLCIQMNVSFFFFFAFFFSSLHRYF